MAYRVNENLIDSIMDDLADFGKRHHCKIIYMNDCPYPNMPSFTDTENDIVYLNTNYYQHRELPFVLGHELGHCVAENSDSFYGCSKGAKLTAEGKADYIGLYLLFHVYLANYYSGGPVDVANLIDMFGIPDQYLAMSKQVVKECLNHAI